MFLRINISISFEVAAWIISELGSDLLVLTRCTFSQFLYFQVSFFILFSTFGTGYWPFWPERSEATRLFRWLKRSSC